MAEVKLETEKGPLLVLNFEFRDDVDFSFFIKRYREGKRTKQEFGVDCFMFCLEQLQKEEGAKPIPSNFLHVMTKISGGQLEIGGEEVRLSTGKDIPGTFEEFGDYCIRFHEELEEKRENE